MPHPLFLFAFQLLQVPLPNAAPPVAVPAWLSPAIAMIALLVTVYTLVRKEAREDGQTASQRLKKLEATVANHDTQRTAEVQARERLADDMRRDYQVLKEETERRCGALEGNAREVQGLRERIASMEAKLDRIPDIDRKLDRLHELLGKALADK